MTVVRTPAPTQLAPGASPAAALVHQACPWGHWPPPNLRPCEPWEFWGHMMTLGFDAWATVDGPETHGGRWSRGQIFACLTGHLAGGGYAVATVSNGRGGADVTYHTWATCEHDFRSEPAGRCITQYTCRSCGARYSIDSSD